MCVWGGTPGSDYEIALPDGQCDRDGHGSSTARQRATAPSPHGPAAAHHGAGPGRPGCRRRRCTSPAATRRDRAARPAGPARPAARPVKSLFSSRFRAASEAFRAVLLRLFLPVRPTVASPQEAIFGAAGGGSRSRPASRRIRSLRYGQTSTSIAWVRTLTVGGLPQQPPGVGSRGCREFPLAGHGGTGRRGRPPVRLGANQEGPCISWNGGIRLPFQQQSVH